MSGRELEVILVPYEVERDDTGMARAPRKLLDHGFLDSLQRAGWSFYQTEVWSRIENGSKADVVADLGRGIARAVASAHARKRFPLILAGGCLSSIGAVAGLQRMGRDLGVIWIDAHGDFNTPESTPSGYWDGMSLAAVCGRSLPEIYKPVELRPIHFRNVIHLAGRAFDPEEVEDIRRLNLAVIPPASLCEDEALQQVQSCAAGKELYLHIDLDGLDPRDAPAVSFPVPGGPSLDDVLRCLDSLQEPAAMTLAGMNFDRVDEEKAQRMVETCLRLVESFVKPV